MSEIQSTTVAKNFTLRILLLSFFIFIVNSWSIHHLGSDLTTFLISNGPLVIIGITGVFSELLTKKEASRMKSKIRRWFFFFLKTPVLCFLYGLLFATGSVVSSVTIMSSGIPGVTILNLGPEGTSSLQSSKRLEKPNAVICFIKLTNPFGRPYYLEVKGFQRYSFDLYPWIGKKIRISEDLEVSPSILVRVPADSLGMISKGKIVVTAGEKVIAQKETQQDKGALLIGDYTGIPNALAARWKMELTARGYEEKPLARSLLSWQYPLVVEPGIRLSQGLLLKAQFIVNDKTWASAKFKVGTAKIQDIVLEKKTSNK